MSNEDLEFTQTMILHDMSMSKEEEIACLGRLAKSIVPMLEDFIKSERQRGTESTAIFYALTKQAGLSIGLFFPTVKYGCRDKIVSLALELLKSDLTSMAETIEKAEKRMAAGGQR